MVVVSDSSQPSSGWTSRLLGCLLLLALNCLVLGLATALIHASMPMDGTRWRMIGVRTGINLCDAILSAQMLFLGYWGALGTERLPVRMGIVIVATAALFGVSLCFYATLKEHFDPDFFPYELGKYAALAVIAWLLLRALRPWRGWRLSWGEVPIQPANRQFRILDLLAWTAAIAFPLGMIRTVFADRSAGFLVESLAPFLFALPIAIPCFCWATWGTARRRRWLWWLVLYGVGFSLAMT